MRTGSAISIAAAFGILTACTASPAPFSVNAPWTYYAYRDSRYAANFFLTLPRAKVRTAINASAYVRIVNHTDKPIWIEGIAGIVHRKDGAWIPLLPIDARKLGAGVYFATKTSGLGRPVPKDEQLTLGEMRPIPPSSQAGGFVFFGFPVKQFPADVDGLTILVRARGGETEEGQNGTIRLDRSPFPPANLSATDLRKFRFRLYCRIANAC